MGHFGLRSMQFSGCNTFGLGYQQFYHIYCIIFLEFTKLDIIRLGYIVIL